jgi:hypothetical protein
MKMHVAVALLSGCTVLMGCKDAFDESATKPSSQTIREYVNKGWLPHGVPDSMKSLKVAGDLDAGRSDGTFTSDGTDAFLAKCHRETNGFAVDGDLPKWFPDDVRDARGSDALRRSGYTLYECEDDYAVIRKGTDRAVWFWSNREDDE